MRKIKIILDYKCYPMWVYDEEGRLIDNNLVDELKNETEIDNILTEIQNIYNGLFEDTSTIFEYKGFVDKSMKNEYINKIQKALLMIKEKVGSKYIIENKVEID